LRIFGYPFYIHVPNEKKEKLEPYGRKGMFVGYNETSKAYQIYIPGQQQIEVGWDVTFQKLDFRRSRETTTETYGEEKEDSEVEESTCPSNIGVQPSDHEEDSEESVDPVEPPSDEEMRPGWLQYTLRDAEKHVWHPGSLSRKESLPRCFRPMWRL
jgi:hypothetical protein